MSTQWQQRASGLLVPGLQARTLQAVDLFCGCGGFSLGLEAAGIDVVGALEWDADALTSYLYNLGSPRGCAVGYTSEAFRQKLAKRFEKSRKASAKGRAQRQGISLGVGVGEEGWIGAARPYPRVDMGCRGMVFGDAGETTGEHILEVMRDGGWRGEVDLVVGGPPCQGMSRSGKQRVDDPRNNLVLEFMRLVGELGAKAFVMENVPPLITSKRFRPLFTAVVERAHELGFSIVANVLDACNYGVPQHRRRAFIMGTRDGYPVPSMPFPTNWGIVARCGEPISWMLEGDEEQAPEPKKKPAQGSLFGGAA